METIFSGSLMLVALSSLAAPALGTPVSFARLPGLGPVWRSAAPAPASASAPVMLWSLTPAEVGELISRIALSDYREVSPDAPVAARFNPAQPQHVRREEVEVSQFHTQDGAGRAVFGYNTADQVRVEARSGDGRVRGSYSYRDPNGKIVKVNYWDDGDGFHMAGNALPSESDVPEPVTETPEVAAARQQHEAAYAAALQASILAGNGEQTDQTRVEGPSGDLPPVYDTDGTELRRYPAPQHASLYDPSHVHDAELDAVIISNPDLEPDSFNDVQLFRSSARARARGYHPHQGQGQRSRRQQQAEDGADVDDAAQAQENQANGFYYGFRYPAPVLVGVAPEFNGQGLSVSQRAVFFGAIPVDAVHDAQVSPAQAGAGAQAWASQYSRKPVYTEASA